MLVEINNIALTYPDIFLADNLAIHGVLAPFVSAKEEDGELALNFSESLECESKAHKLASVAHESHDNVDWGTVIHSLSSSGFIPSWSTHLCMTPQDDISTSTQQQQRLAPSQPSFLSTYTRIFRSSPDSSVAAT
ncbi:hypothetical protein MLD38_017850 [Melastoma candidum]|uniref:Uncharacterized protein n=1 Tax=Melastoma candidum TaxID=119954 RepID=A0ACB9QVH8_9MYRT|nr:hypothetical protein MLD38_017850 [Melastoma candidum]